MERFKSMAPDEQKQFIARMKDRGQDTAAFEALITVKGGAKKAPATPGTGFVFIAQEAHGSTRIGPDRWVRSHGAPTKKPRLSGASSQIALHAARWLPVKSRSRPGRLADR